VVHVVGLLLLQIIAIVMNVLYLVEKIEFFGDLCCWVVAFWLMAIVSNCYCYACFVEVQSKSKNGCHIL
jgi:hypothetical protein